MLENFEQDQEKSISQFLCVTSSTVEVVACVLVVY